MYWPLGPPRVYASNDGPLVAANVVQSSDGLFGPSAAAADGADQIRPFPLPAHQFDLSEHDVSAMSSPTTLAPPTVQSVELDDDNPGAPLMEGQEPPPPVEIPILSEPVLALRLARAGNLFASLTRTSMTIWQTKPVAVLATIVRSKSSLETYGDNVDLLLRPDAAILVARTEFGFLITYSLAMDSDARVYKAHFSSYSNVQKRRQSQVVGQPGLPADQFLWGPGEGGGVPDISVQFRMVIKVDAGIESALALDDELIVATRKPPAIQCIRWTPDSEGTQTRTELLSRMAWVERKVFIRRMVHDRAMNLAVWITSDGRAYAVQRAAAADGPEKSKDDSSAEVPALFGGHPFHLPEGEANHAAVAAINARFSLVTVGCVDGSIRVYSARDYDGNIPHSHTHLRPSSSAGPLTSLDYSPDGYCLFAGYRHGWAMWSVYGKGLSSSFGHFGHYETQAAAAAGGAEGWLDGIQDSAWVGGGAEIILASPLHRSLWVLEMARSAVTGCYSAANLFRTVLQTPTSIMVYRGYDLPDLTTLSTEPFLWHTSRIPLSYLLHQWPIRCTAVSPDGRYVAVAGRRGLAHYSVASGRWKTFASEEMENEFHVRGGMCWYQHFLVAAVDTGQSYELRLYSRESALDGSLVLHVETIPAAIVLVSSAGEDSLLVYTHDNILYHFIVAPGPGGVVRLIQVGQIGFHGIVRSPARVRALTWLVPESQLLHGDPAADVTVASVVFLVDGKLVLLRPSINDQGQLKYDMRAVAHNVEFHASMTDQPASLAPPPHDGTEPDQSLRSSLWTFDGVDLKVWASVDSLLRSPVGESCRDRDSAAPISISVDFYPLSLLLGKGIALGIESLLVVRKDINFGHFRFSIRVQLVLPDILRSYLIQSKKSEATRLAQQYQGLAYFPHALELLLHRVLDEEVDTGPSPDVAVLPRVLSLLSSFREYLEIVLGCTRKTEVRQWRTLFAYLPPAQELFEECLQRGSLKTAGGYLLILHTLDELGPGSEHSVRLLSRAMKENDWELCKELARFLAAMDETGEALRDAMRQVNLPDPPDRVSLAPVPPRLANGNPRAASSDRPQAVGDGDSMNSGFNLTGREE